MLTERGVDRDDGSQGDPTSDEDTLGHRVTEWWTKGRLGSWVAAGTTSGAPSTTT